MPKAPLKTPKAPLGAITTHARSKAGRRSPWSTEQLGLINNSIATFHNYSFVELNNVACKGRDNAVAKWKKDEADRLLQLEEFKVLPDNVRSFILCCVSILTAHPDGHHTREEHHNSQIY